MPPYQIVDLQDPHLERLDPKGALIIVCRYASSAVTTWIEESAPHLAGVGLFLDDDIPAVVLSGESSIRYKLSLLIKAILPLRRLNRHLDIVWVSTPKLAQTMKAVAPVVLPPAPPERLWVHSGRRSKDNDKNVLVAYHATGIHVKEHHFLQPILAAILAARPNVSFEVFADRRTRPIWKGMDRVILRDPLSWSDYLQETASRQIDIMLVPLAPSQVNSCRAPTKRIDVARVGAAGIFSASEPYGFPDDSGEHRLPYDPAQWERAILKLIDDPGERMRAAHATRLIVEHMAHEARRGLGLAMS
jgi:hypothetical protein